MASITSKSQTGAGSARKSGLPISGKSEKLTCSNGKPSNSSASISSMNKCSNSMGNSKSGAICYNLGVSKIPSSSIVGGKTNVTSNTKDKSQTFINMEKKNDSMSAKNNSFGINVVVTAKNDKPSTFGISSAKPTKNLGLHKVIEKDKSTFLLPKNTKMDIKIDVLKTNILKTASWKDSTQTQPNNPIKPIKVDLFRNQREYKQTTISSNKSFDNVNCTKDTARKNSLINANVINMNKNDSNSMGNRNTFTGTESTISNVVSKNKNESTKSNLDTNKTIEFDTRKSSITRLESVKKCTVSKPTENPIASVSNSLNDTEFYFKTQPKNYSSSEDRMISVNTKDNDSVCNKVNVIINKKNYDSDLSNVFTVKRCEVPMVVPAKPKEKSNKLFNKCDNIGNEKKAVNYEDYKGIDRKNKIQTFVMGRKFSLQDTKNVFPKEINDKMKNKRRGSESINLISKEKTFYLLDKKKNDFRNENKIDFTYKTKANEISKMKTNSDLIEQKPYSNTSGFSTDMSNENYSPSYSAAMAPKRKSKFIFGIIWLPLRKRNKDKNIVYHPHNYDYGERSPSMYPLMSGDSTENQPYKKKEEETELLVIEKKVAVPSAGLVAEVEAPVQKIGNIEPIAEEKEEFIRRENEDSRDGAGDTNERDHDDKKDDKDEKDFLEDKPKKNQLDKNKLVDKVDSVYLRPPPPHKTRSNTSTVEEESCGMKCLYFTLQCCDCTLM